MGEEQDKHGSFLLDHGLLAPPRSFEPPESNSEDWARPYPDIQGTLFPVSVSIALAKAEVTQEEAASWHGHGWLSFDVRHAETLDWPEIQELTFVRYLARSELTNAQIDMLLSNLPKPFAYDSRRVAYSFVYGWVTLPKLDMDTTINESIEDWIESMAEAGEDERLLEVYRKLQDTLDGVQLKRETDT